jgi:hypothetical protein
LGIVYEQRDSKFQEEDQFSRDYEDLTYSDDQVSKKDDKVRDDEYQPSENDDEMSEVDMLLSGAP